MDPVHPGLTSLQDDFIAIMRSTGNAMATGIAGKGELGMLVVQIVHTLYF